MCGLHDNSVSVATGPRHSTRTFNDVTYPGPSSDCLLNDMKIQSNAQNTASESMGNILVKKTIVMLKMIMIIRVMIKYYIEHV